MAQEFRPILKIEFFSLWYPVDPRLGYRSVNYTNHYLATSRLDRSGIRFPDYAGRRDNTIGRLPMSSPQFGSLMTTALSAGFLKKHFRVLASNTQFSIQRKLHEKHLRANTPTVVMTDIRMPGEDGLSLLSTFTPSLPTSCHRNDCALRLDSAVASYSRGAFEYLA